MRKILCGAIVVTVVGLLNQAPTPLFAQWERWQPWVTELGVTPYTEINFRGSQSDSLGYYELQRTGLDFIIGVQVVIPPLYMRYGFSNIYNIFMSREDTIFCPLFADWRLGAQITYEEITTYDLSVSFLKSFADEDFMAILLEIGYGRIVADLPLGGLQILGNVGIGSITQSVPDTSGGRRREGRAKAGEGVFDLCLGVFWRTPFVSPYLYTGICYPFAKEEEGFELRSFIGIGLQVYFPNSYVKPIPEVAYPKLFKGPSKTAG